MNTTTHFPNRGNTTNHKIVHLCGTHQAYLRHLRHHEAPCVPCTEANRIEGARYRESRRTELNTYHQQWYAQADKPTRFERRIRKHGLTVERYAWMLYDQGFACAVCKTPEPGGRGNEWSVDHDHACCAKAFSCGKCVRGLLCMNCNHGLGSFADSVESLRSAVLYLLEAG